MIASWNGFRRRADYKSPTFSPDCHSHKITPSRRIDVDYPVSLEVITFINLPRKMIETTNATHGPPANAPATGSDGEKEKSIKLTKENCAYYNTHLMAFRVKTADLFNEATYEQHRRSMAALSQEDERIMLVSTEDVMPSICKRNMVFNNRFMNNHMQRFLPLSAVIGKNSLRDVFNDVYQDPEAADRCSRLAQSVTKHTTEPFSQFSDTPEQFLPKQYLEDQLTDDELLVVFCTFTCALQKLANNDMQIMFISDTEVTSTELTLGLSKHIRVVPTHIYASAIHSKETYSPTAKTNSQLGLRVSDAVFKEYRFMIRQALKFGTGDCGTAPAPEHTDNSFEADLLQSLVSAVFKKGPGALSMCSSCTQFGDMIYTIIPNDTVYEIACEPEAVWIVYLTQLLDKFSASNISHIKVADGTAKMLKYLMLSGNPLTNLQLIAARGSPTTSAHVCYLTQRVCKQRIPQRHLGDTVDKCTECTVCACGEDCAAEWVSAFTNWDAIKSNVTDRKGCYNKESQTFNQIYITEYNNLAGILGGAGKKIPKKGGGGDTILRAGPELLEAHKMMMDKFLNKIKGPSNKSSKNTLGYLYATLKEISDFAENAGHRQAIINRGECHKNALESILTSNSGGANILSMGWLGLVLSKCKVLTYMGRFAVNKKFKIGDFFDNPTAEFNTAIAAIATKYLGVYSDPEDQDNLMVNAYNILPTLSDPSDPEGEKNDVNGEPQQKMVNVKKVRTKTSNKFKFLNGVLKPADNRGRCGGMEFGSTRSPLADSQMTMLMSSLNNIMSWLVPEYDCTQWHRSVKKLIMELLALPMGQFDNKCLLLPQWDQFLSVYVTGLLMVNNDYFAAPNKYYTGVTMPMFVQLKGTKEQLYEPVSHTFLKGGPTLVMGTTKMSHFVSDLGNRIVTCEMTDFRQMSTTLGANRISGCCAPVSGVFLPLRRVAGSKDANSVERDDLAADMREMINKGRLDRCETLQALAPKILAKIRNAYRNTDDAVVTYDDVYDMFDTYKAHLLLNDPSIAEMAQHLDDNDRLSAICQRVRQNREEVQNGEGDDEDGMDFSSFMTGGEAAAGEKRKFADHGLDDDDDDESVAEATAVTTTAGSSQQTSRKKIKLSAAAAIADQFVDGADDEDDDEEYDDQ